MYYENAHLQAYRGGWRGVLKYRDDSGGWRQRSKVLEATGKRAAARELAEWRDEMERAHELETEAATPTEACERVDVPSFVSIFIDRLEVSGAVEASTVMDYRRTLSRIRRSLAGIDAAALTSTQASEAEAAELKRGMKPATVGKMHRLLKQAYGEAVAVGELDRNPFDAVKPPKRPRPRPNALDAAGRSSLLEFLDICEPAPEVLAGIIALYTGMRRGEVCAITWRDVDIQGRTIRVSKAVGIGAGEDSTYLKQPKSDRPRTVPIPDALVPYLEAERAAQAGAFGERATRSAYVLTGTSSPMNPTILTRRWAVVAKLAGIRGTEGRVPTFHDLRHTYATAAVAAGIDIKAVSSILGHASAAMTLDVYASADPDSIARAGLIMSDAIRRPLAPVVPRVGREYAKTG